MALVKTTLEARLRQIFASMRDGSKDDAWMAAQISDAIKTYILTGEAATTDAGAAPAGSYAGAGSGTMTIDKDNLKSDLQSTFEAAYENAALAAHMAADSDKACKADNTVSTISTGLVTTPSGASSPFSGPGQGKFAGTKATIENILKACFSTMNGMSSGGDDYLAAQIASAVDSYLKAGSISVALKPPFASGSGKGTIA
jgi:hypothetical protein